MINKDALDVNNLLDLDNTKKLFKKLKFSKFINILPNLKENNLSNFVKLCSMFNY